MTQEKTIYDLPDMAVKTHCAQIRKWFTEHETELAFSHLVSRTITASKEDWKTFFGLLSPERKTKRKL